MPCRCLYVSLAPPLGISQIPRDTRLSGASLFEAHWMRFMFIAAGLCESAVVCAPWPRGCDAVTLFRREQLNSPDRTFTCIDSVFIGNCWDARDLTSQVLRVRCPIRTFASRKGVGHFSRIWVRSCRDLSQVQDGRLSWR